MTAARRSREAWRDRWLVVAVLLLAGALHGWNLDAMSIWQDEGLSLYRAKLDLAGILSGIIPLGDLPTRDVHPPLYFLTLAGWFRAVGATTWTAKWLSWLLILPTPALVWALGRATIGRRPALVAALLAALSPLYLWYAQEIRSYGLIVVLGLVAVYALWRALVRSGSPVRRLGWALLCVAATAALLWTHYLGFLLLPVLAALSVATLTRVRDARALVPLALLAVLALPLLPFAIDRLGLGAERDQRFVPLTEMVLDIVRGFGFGRTLYHVDALAGPGGPLVWALIAVFALVLAAGWLAAWRTRRAGALLLAAYLLLPVAALYVVTLVKPIYLGAYHIILASPPFYLLLAAGLVAVADRARGAGMALAVVVVAVMLTADANYYRDTRLAKDDLRALARYVDAHAVPGDVLAVSDPVLERSFEHLVRNVPVVAVPRMLYTSTLDDRPPAEQLAPLLDAHGRIWFMTPLEPHRSWLERNAVRVDHEAFHGASIPVHVTAYEPAVRGWREAMTPVAGADGDLGGLRLRGWNVTPSPLAAGRAARVGLLWEPMRAGLPDYKVAVRLLDGRGRDWAEGDHEPFRGERPVSSWPPEDHLYEPHDVIVSPGAQPGAYRLAVTVYDPVSGDRYPVGAPLELGTVSVERAAVPPEPATLPFSARIGAKGRAIDVLGIRTAATTHAPGETATVDVWLRARASGTLSGTLQSELLDAAFRTKSQAEAVLSDAVPGAIAPGDLLLVPVELRMPAAAGRYGLRLRLLEPDGRAQTLFRGPLPVRGLWSTFMEVGAVARTAELPPGATSLEIDVGEAITLVGLEGGDWSATPGGDLPVALYWRARAPVAVGYHVTVQLLPLDREGELAGPPVAQSDGVPAGGRRPVTGWVPGEIVADPRALALPDTISPGPYALIAALYDPEAPSAPRPQVEQDGAVRDHVRLGSVTVRSGGATEPMP